MKVLVTGATGFVGSALLSRFVADGAEVSALVRRHLDALPVGVEQVVGDLAGLHSRLEIPDQVRDDGVSRLEIPAFAGMTGVDVVVHAAARAHIMRDEVSDPLAEYRKVNRDATLALARLAAQAGVK